MKFPGFTLWISFPPSLLHTPVYWRRACIPSSPLKDPSITTALVFPKPCPGRGQTHLCQAGMSDLRQFCGCNPLSCVGIPQTSSHPFTTGLCLSPCMQWEKSGGRVLHSPLPYGSDMFSNLRCCLEDFGTVYVNRRQLTLTWQVLGASFFQTELLL